MIDLYDNLANSYDLLISWKRRLKREKPFFSHFFKQYRVRRILDTACGTGVHAVAFHDWGYYVVGTDISAPMVEMSRQNAGDRPIEFVQAGFDELSTLGSSFDAVTCLGNSLPHVLEDTEIDNALSKMYSVLLPGGIIIIHGNNYDRILSQQERFMPLVQTRNDGSEFLFLRFFDFNDDILTFNVVTLQKDNGTWRMLPDSSKHRALTKSALIARLEKAGFTICNIFGGYPNEHFDPEQSDNLIIVAQKPHSVASKPIPEPIKAINRIPIRDNGEPLVDVIAEVPQIERGDRPVYARNTVMEMLRQAQSLLPEGHHLKVRIAYRTREYQEMAYREFYARLAEQHPDWPASQLRREINKFLAPPDAKHPPGHTTGGAVDLTIIGPNGEELDMMSTIEPEEAQWGVFPTYSKKITPRAAWNRQLLADVMTQAGFSNFPGEWWHYSYGDSAWAVRVKAPYAIYGESKTELPKHVIDELNTRREWK